MEDEEEFEVTPDTEDVQDFLFQLIEDHAEELTHVLDLKSTDTFHGAMLLTSDNGLVLNTVDGSQFQVTIVRSR